MDDLRRYTEQNRREWNEVADTRERYGDHDDEATGNGERHADEFAAAAGFPDAADRRQKAAVSGTSRAHPVVTHHPQSQSQSQTGPYWMA